MFLEFRDLEEFAAHIGYEHPEEIHAVAACEGFYESDDQGDRHLSKDGINDFLRRLDADIRVVYLAGTICCETVDHPVELTKTKERKRDCCNCGNNVRIKEG